MPAPMEKRRDAVYRDVPDNMLLPESRGRVGGGGVVEAKGPQSIIGCYPTQEKLYAPLERLS